MSSESLFKLKSRPVDLPRFNFGIGGNHPFTLIAGPCSIESISLLNEVGDTLSLERTQTQSKLNLAFRGGIFKMRTNPDAFQGLGLVGEQAPKGEYNALLDALIQFKKKFNFPVISEITDLRSIPELIEIVDIFQVGSRNMYNYPLLSELGKAGKPVLLKRAFSATFEEWLGACKYIEREGNSNIILCERGIRSFEPKLRNTLDLGMVALLKAETHYPVLVDPSHGCGRSDLVIPLALASKAVGADGLLVEFHPRPSQALSDGFQSLDVPLLKTLVRLLLNGLR